MTAAARAPKILLIDTNVYFSKRLSDALKREGFDVTSSTQPAFALTTLEYDAPTAIVCSTNMREMGALDIARMIRADAKNAAMPVIALGDAGQRALMEAFQAGCDDYIDRTRPHAVIASHIKNIIVSKAEGFKPTQMLAQSDTSLSGSLTHHDLPGVMQMLGHAHQTGALHINSGDTDALLFFDAGDITHAECGALFGDEAVIHILKNCFKNNSGEYKFVYGSASTQRTVLRSSTDLMLDAMREVDEATREDESAASEQISVPENLLSAAPEVTATPEDVLESEIAAPVVEEQTSAPEPLQDFVAAQPETEPNFILHSNDFSAAPQSFDQLSLTDDERPVEAAPELDDSAPEHTDDFAAITDILDRFAVKQAGEPPAVAEANETFGITEPLAEQPTQLDAPEPETFDHFTEEPAPEEPATALPVENSEIPATGDQTEDHTVDHPVIPHHEEAL
jgi:CheY-like chemotaxis protein